MKTELSDIKLAIAIYEGRKYATYLQWKESETYLLQVYDKYGTTNPWEIKELLK